MQTYCRAVLRDLAITPPDRWAEEWIEARMEFNRLFPHGLLSTSHGIDFFDNVLIADARDEEGNQNEAWLEEGEYGDNFRKMFE